jgi:hypothetical protein
MGASGEALSRSGWRGGEIGERTSWTYGGGAGRTRRTATDAKVDDGASVAGFPKLATGQQANKPRTQHSPDTHGSPPT